MIYDSDDEDLQARSASDSSLALSDLVGGIDAEQLELLRTLRQQVGRAGRDVTLHEHEAEELAANLSLIADQAHILAYYESLSRQPRS